MYFYEASMGVLVAANAYLFWSQRLAMGRCVERPSDRVLEEDGERTRRTDRARRFQLEFFPPYALAVAADWLQGPHIYAIYRYEKDISERMVAALYAAGFLAGGISASFAGGLADRYGRKGACLSYCGLYSLTCLTMLSNNLAILFVGRIVGGICTTLLFSVFETWMISDYHGRCLQASVMELGTIFGNMTTVSCIAAIISGITGDVLVQVLGGRTWPFLAAIGCCLAAGVLIAIFWQENSGTLLREHTFIKARRAGRAILQDPRILSLGLVSCIFEGTMYLFIFFWSAALKSARSRAGAAGDVPFGLVFSCFMCAMMAGSALFNCVDASRKTKQYSVDIVLAVTLLVSCSLGFAVMFQDEKIMFWAFCLMEGCIGAYFPAMALLKSELVDDRIRGSVYSILRIPLNVFVVVAHSLDQEGDSHRNDTFLLCGALLVAVFLVAQKYLS